MFRIGLLLRFCLMLIVSIGLTACVSNKPVSTNSAGGGTPNTVLVAKKCPESLEGLSQLQAKGEFLNCDVNKDGAGDRQVTLENQNVWLLIDTQKSLIEVKRGEQTLVSFPHIAIGQNGAGFKKHRGDKITPLGEYKIGWINEQSQFRLFYGLTYPSVENAKQAFSNGLISKREHDAIIYAHEHNQIPPQNTALGGQVGVHGLGNADEKIHQILNWTHGCVAITNNQVDELDRWIVEGMRVKIK